MTAQRRTRVVAHPRNEGTWVVARTRAPRAWSATEVQRALERVHGWRAEHPEGAAVAVLVQDGARLDVALRQLDGEEPAAVIIGRHSQCDVVIDGGAAASLRHAAVVVWPSTPARAVVWDLRSELGLALRDGRTARRISSARACGFGAGAAEIAVLVADHDAPFAVRWADELDAVLDGALREGELRVDDAPAPAQRAWEHSVVVVRTRTAGPPAIPEEALAVRATRAEVERGLVLGRYERCDRTTAVAEEAAVSRVHALVFVHDDALWVVDTASSCGTELEAPGGTLELGEGRRMARLPPDARLLLAGVEALLVVEG